MKRIVITGALGYIGSRLIRELPALFPQAEIVMLDNLHTQRFSSLFNLPDGVNYRFVNMDILDENFPSAIEGASAVVHLAAITDAARSFANKELVHKVNLDGTGCVARACARAGIPMVFVSTTSVYGVQSGEVNEDCTELKPQSPYAESKLQAEQLLDELAATVGLRHTTCRCGTIFGNSPGMRYHTAVTLFVWQACTGQPITVWRTAMNQQRPYLDLSDAVRAIGFILRKNEFNGRLYNVVTLNATVADIINVLREQAGDVDIKLVDTRIMNQLSYTVNSDRFRALGFEYTGDLRKSLGEMIALLKNLKRK